MIWLSVVLAILVSLFYMKLLDWYAVQMAYFTVGLVGFGLFILGYYFYDLSNEKSEYNEDDGGW